MKLIGFTFFGNQEEFKAWQVSNPGNNVHTVQPHASEIAIKDDKEKYTTGQNAEPKWGVFVTYSYET